jgi:hypothetical protein
MSTVAVEFWNGVLARRKAEDEAFEAQQRHLEHMKRVWRARDARHEIKVKHKLCLALLRGGHLITSDVVTPVYLPPDHPVRIAAVETAQKLIELSYTQPSRSAPVLQTYLPPDHPVRIFAQERARKYQEGCTTDLGRSTDRSKVDLGPQPTYAKTTTLHPRRVGNEAKFLGQAQREAEFWQPEHMGEAEQTFAFEKSEVFADPLVTLLRKERSVEAADELERRHSAGSMNNTLRFYLQQRPDTQERQAPGEAWVSTSTSTRQVEVRPYVRNRKTA